MLPVPPGEVGLQATCPTDTIRTYVYVVDKVSSPHTYEVHTHTHTELSLNFDTRQEFTFQIFWQIQRVSTFSNSKRALANAV